MLQVKWLRDGGLLYFCREVIKESNGNLINLNHNIRGQVSDYLDSLAQTRKISHMTVSAASHPRQLQQSLIGLFATSHPRVTEWEHIQVLVPPEGLLKQIMTP